MQLPEAFLERMKTELEDEFESFLKSYENPAVNALRVNTLKTDGDELKELTGFLNERVSWCGEGYYYEGKKGSHHASIAGLFYSQEPSAMITAEKADIQKGDFVLDLCAAPGGKSTQIAAKLGGTGLLVSNEVNSGRAKILCENIQRLGIKNAVITNMYPEKMEKTFEKFFDKIVVDAPCSGEGMFRKDPAAIAEWSIEHTHACANRQLSILLSAEKMLKDGGRICYSTCTFAREENELLCERFINEAEDISLVEMHRMMPHKIKGEGHFCAVFEKHGEGKRKSREIKAMVNKEHEKLFREFEKENLNTFLKGDFVSFGEVLYLLPEGFGSLDKIRCVCAGTELGEVRKGRFIPAHHLLRTLEKKDFKRTIAPDEKNLSAYLRGEELSFDGEKGYGAILYADKFPVGWYKQSQNAVKNHYPKYLRG